MDEREDVRRIRDLIDETDDAILDMIERRLGLAAEMAAAKAGESGSPLRPARETDILQRLKGRARSATPRLVEIVWRELIGQGRQAQGPMRLVLFSSGNAPLLDECARRHFSSAIPVERADSAEAAVASARSGPVIAVLDTRLEEPDLVDLGEIRSSAGAVVGFAYARVTARSGS